MISNKDLGLEFEESADRPSIVPTTATERERARTPLNSALGKIDDNIDELTMRILEKVGVAVERIVDETMVQPPLEAISSFQKRQGELLQLRKMVAFTIREIELLKGARG